jgi:hypothetical protein
MKKLVSVLIIAGALTTFNMQVFAQDLLPVVTVTAANYKYLKSVTDTAGAEQVKLLQRRAASFDVKTRNTTRMSMKIILSRSIFPKERFLLYMIRAVNLYVQQKGFKT